MTSAESCSTCRFFRATSALGGVCRRYPKQITETWKRPSGADTTEEFTTQKYPYMKTTEWCGEYAPAEGEKT